MPTLEVLHPDHQCSAEQRNCRESTQRGDPDTMRQANDEALARGIQASLQPASAPPRAARAKVPVDELAAQRSLIDKVAMAKAMPKAEAQRVLEIETSKLFNFREDKVHTDAFSLAIQNNYGHAGIIFVQYVMAHMAETKLLVETLQRQIDKAAGLGPENRFWSAACAVTLAAAVICKHLGLID